MSNSYKYFAVKRYSIQLHLTVRHLLYALPTTMLACFLSAANAQAQIPYEFVESRRYFGDEMCLPIISSGRSLEEVLESENAQTYQSAIELAVQAANGKFAVASGAVRVDQFQEQRTQFVEAGLLPEDTYCLATSDVATTFEPVSAPPTIGEGRASEFRSRQEIRGPNIIDTGHALVDGHYIELGTYLHPEGSNPDGLPYGILAGAGLDAWMKGIGASCSETIDFRSYSLDYEAFNSYSAIEIELDWSSCAHYRDHSNYVYLDAVPESYKNRSPLIVQLVDDTLSRGIFTSRDSAQYFQLHYYEETGLPLDPVLPRLTKNVLDHVFETYCIFIEEPAKNNVMDTLNTSGLLVRSDVTFTAGELSTHYNNSSTLEELFEQFGQAEYSAYLHERSEGGCFQHLYDDVPDSAVVALVQIKPFQEVEFERVLNSLSGIIGFVPAPNYIGGGSPTSVFRIGAIGITDDMGNIVGEKVLSVFENSLKSALREPDQVDLDIVSLSFPGLYRFNIFGYGSYVSGVTGRWERLTVELTLGKIDGAIYVAIGMPVTQARVWKEEPRPIFSTDTFEEVTLDPAIDDFRERIAGHLCSATRCGLSSARMDNVERDWIR